MSPYLDHASTTPLHPAARTAMADAEDAWADPSRLYGGARRARIVLDDARAAVASVIGGRAEEIVFTSGGTESCNQAISGAARAAVAARKPSVIVVSAVEHTAVLEAARALERDGFEVREVRVDERGRVDLEALGRACEGGAGVVSLQTANPEVGTLQPLREAAEVARAAGAIVHTDACMTVGHLPTEVTALGVDLLSASSHKSYGPKGAGVLWVRRGVRVRPLLVGDDRERGRRAGIENLPAIAGMAAALTARAAEIEGEPERLRGLAARIRDGLPDDVLAHGDPDRCLPGLVSFTVPGLEADAMLLGFDRRDLAVHAGSSCTAATTEPSHVLRAMGRPPLGALRVSLGRETTAEDAEAFVRAVPEVIAEARGAS